MTIRIEHLLVPARDKHAAARYLAELLGLDVTDRSSGAEPGRFAVVPVGDVTLDFDTVEHFDSQHYAFAVDDATFDAVLDQVRARELEWAADPGYQAPRSLNDNGGGRGFYVRDPEGHSLEFLTSPITG